jgi:protein-tyrosine phosphatase
MVDLHAHILPGIDDGPKELAEAEEMCSLAYQDGIRTIVATPHVGKFPNTFQIITQKREELQNKIDSEGIDLRLVCGADFEFSPDIFTQIEKKTIITINNSRYILLDIPFFLMPPNICGLVERMIQRGIVPIITHPERCLQIQQDLKLLYDIVKAGALVQITASSITGKMGGQAQDTVRLILKYDLAHIIASDTHGLHNRPPLLSEAVELASRISSRSMVSAMVSTIPQLIIENACVEVSQPRKPH